MKLTGKTAVVTGGARGIGRATVLSLAAEGCQVAIADIRVAPAVLFFTSPEADFITGQTLSVSGGLTMV